MWAETILELIIYYTPFFSFPILLFLGEKGICVRMILNLFPPAVFVNDHSK